MSTVAASTDLSAACRITLGGSELDPALVARVIELRVETTAALPDVCTIRLMETSPAAGGELKVIDDARFKLGSPLAVRLAKPIGGQLAPVFDGEITTVEAELGAGDLGDPVLELVVVAHDRSHRMHRQTTTRTFRQVTVTDIARKMAKEHGLKLGTLAEIGGGAAEVRHQVGETDWAFLSRLVANHGGELNITGGALHVVDPEQKTSAVAELVYGENLSRFRPRVSTVGQVAEVTVHGWDPLQKQEIVAEARPKASTEVERAAVDGDVGGTSVLISGAAISTAAEAKAQAAAVARHIGHERVQATAVVAGDPKLLAGEYVAISGVGTRFGGTHRIVSAVHLYGARGYTTRLTLGAGGRPLADAVGGARPHAFADHLAVALVTANDDPDKLGRVKVKYPVLGGEVESGWARIVWGAAGSARGVVALPHVNDEVVVGFEHGDVRRPFVLGTLFNGKDTPGADLVKPASSLAARFPRDLDVATQKQTLLASDEGLTLTTSKGPIELSAGKEMKLAASAGGAPSALTIETTGQVKMNGKQGVEISATGPLKITSQAPVTVESSAALQLKGAVVQVQASGVLQLSGATVMLG
ncbi:MAG TPA: VgrG-related protein [Solirubrobacteraceae bacterium]|nr:VgrG-related protein [Solirubrobacteraceae bacterium]